MSTQMMDGRRNSVEAFRDPPFARALFGEVRWAWIWVIPRLYAGWVWLQAGWEKLHDPTWTGAKAGTAISGFVNHAISLTGGEHPAVQGWYAWFLQHAVLPAPHVWSYLVSWGELLVGVALILGLFTGIAAFFGSFMNMNYLLAGSVSTNPILLVIAVLLALAWKTAGWWGLDRWVLPALGTPWRPGLVFQEHKGQEQRESGGQRRAEHPGRA